MSIFGLFSKKNSTPKDEFFTACLELDNAMEKFSIHIDQSSMNRKLSHYSNLFYLRGVILRVKRLSLKLFPDRKRLLIIIKEVLFLIKSTTHNCSSDNFKSAILNLEDEIDIYKRNRLFVPAPFLIFIPKFKILIRRAYFSKSLLTKIVSGLYVSGFISLALLIVSGSARYANRAISSGNQRRKLQNEFLRSRENSLNNQRAISFLENKEKEIKSSESGSISIDIGDFYPDGYEVYYAIVKIDPTINWSKLTLPDVTKISTKLEDLQPKLNSERKEDEAKLDKIDKIDKDEISTLVIDDFFLIIIVMASGTLGSIISIFIRVREFDRDEGSFSDALTPILIGVFKPLIGASFALFLWALINSEIISSKLFDLEQKKLYVFITISFVAGFSERLVQDIIKKTELSISEISSSSLPSDSEGSSYTSGGSSSPSEGSNSTSSSEG